MEKRNGKFSAGGVSSKDGQPAVRTVSRPSKESGSPRKNFLPNSTVLFLLGQVVPSGDFAH